MDSFAGQGRLVRCAADGLGFGGIDQIGERLLVVYDAIEKMGYFPLKRMTPCSSGDSTHRTAFGMILVLFYGWRQRLALGAISARPYGPLPAS